MLYLVATDRKSGRYYAAGAGNPAQRGYSHREDTRKTGFLLKHFDIRKPQMVFQEHNEDRASASWACLLRENRSPL